MDFDKIYGHDSIKAVLKNSVAAKRISHAYIFEGPRGVGRFSLALAFAKAILCENPMGGAPCGVCKSCLMAKGGSHPDIRVVSNALYEVGDNSSDILVGTIREMKKEIYIKPFYSERKIYIVPKAETINETAQNSLLKVFEEPPPYCTVILISENNNAFLQTILSRAVVFRFNALPDETVRKYLFQRYPALDEALLSSAAAMSGGSILKAASFIENEDEKEAREDIISLLLQLSSSRKRTLYDIINGFKKYSPSADFLMQTITMWFLDCTHAKLGGSIANLDKKAELLAFCEGISDDAPFLLLEIAVRYSEHIKRRGKFSLAVSCMMTEIWEVLYDRDNWNKI